MQKYTVSTIGTFHTNNNEDASVLAEMGDDRVLIAVMDGCSMGKESHFAATLMAKLLRKMAKEISYKAFVKKQVATSRETLQEIVKTLFTNLKAIKQELWLEVNELLSTLIIGVYDGQKAEVALMVIGDGIICANGTLHEYDQGDKPDYLAYHLDNNFQTWLATQTQQLYLQNINDISLASDGIYTFRHFNKQAYPPITEQEIIRYLLTDKQWATQKNMLKKKLLVLEHQFGLRSSDDLTIVRILSH
jgi:hypothetical protein